MKNYTQLKLNSAFVFACFSLIMLSSCGSYQYVGSTSDGIYSEDEPEYVVIEDVSYQEESNSNYYSNYFKEKALEVEGTEDVNPVFTDVDSYESQSNVNSNQNAGWGDNSSQVNITVYDNGWNNWGYGYANYGWNNWGYGYNSFGWNRPYGWNYGYGWNNWGWNSGFYGGYYGGFYPNYGYGYGYYGNPYYGYNGYRNNYAYNNTRRGSGNGYLNRNYNSNSRNNNNSVLSRRSSTNSNGTRVSTQPRGRTEDQELTTLAISLELVLLDIIHRELQHQELRHREPQHQELLRLERVHQDQVHLEVIQLQGLIVLTAVLELATVAHLEDLDNKKMKNEK
jgi:hypothetical protein